MISRRDLVLGGLAGGVAMQLTSTAGRARPASPRVELIAAPTNLGLRPNAENHEPGTWRAPAAFLSAGLAERLHATRVVQVPRPRYELDMQPGTRVRNGVTLREHGLRLAEAVAASVSAGGFPVVLGGDCSILLGCLAGARRAGRLGLVHVDGHSDFFHPGNYDAATRLGAAAGMDLALATGRGELLLTDWPGAGRPLVEDDDVVQIGERDGDASSLDAEITQLSIQRVLELGIAETARRATAHLADRHLERAWLHVDLDVLDQTVLPAVDSPGSPGLDLPRLADLLARLVATRRVVGMGVAIYDPELDPSGRYLPGLVDCLDGALEPLGSPASALGAGQRE